MTNDSTKTIQRSATSFLSGTLLARISGMLRDVIMAAAFGTESAIAAFLVAYRFAHLARRLFGEGSLQNTFIPHFEDLRKTSEKRAFSFFQDLHASLLIFLIFLVGIGIGVIQLLLHTIVFEKEVAQILFLTCLMLPSLIFICLFGLNGALLACEKKYFITAAAPIAFNCVWVGAALLFANMPINQAVHGLSIAIVLGCFAQMALTWKATFEILPRGMKIFHAHPFSSDIKNLIKPLFLANLGVAASQINNALDPLFALFANAEAPAWLWYAIRVQQLPLALFGVAFANALVPPISRAIKGGNMEQFHHFFGFAKVKVIAFTTLMTAGIFATAPTCINLLFGRGQFGMESVSGTSLCLLGYGIGLLPMAYVLIASPTLFAFGDYKTPTRGALFSMLFNTLLNAFFIFVLKWDGESVAIATSLAAFWNAAYLHRALKKYAQGNEKLPVRKLALVCLAAFSSVWALDFWVLGVIPALQVIRGAPLHLSQNILSQTGIFSLEVGVFFLAAAIAAYLLNAKELYGRAN